MNERARQAAGQPTGGQFAATAGTDAGLDLADGDAQGVDSMTGGGSPVYLFRMEMERARLYDPYRDRGLIERDAMMAAIADSDSDEDLAEHAVLIAEARDELGPRVDCNPRFTISSQRYEEKAAEGDYAAALAAAVRSAYDPGRPRPSHNRAAASVHDAVDQWRAATGTPVRVTDDSRSLSRWMARRVNDRAIQRSAARALVAEVFSDGEGDVETLADHLDGIGHPELGQRLLDDYEDSAKRHFPQS